MSLRSVPLSAAPSPLPAAESTPLLVPADLLWNRLDLPRRRLFAQRLALLLRRRQVAREIHSPEAHHDR